MAIRNWFPGLILLSTVATTGYRCSYQTHILLLNRNDTPRAVQLQFQIVPNGTPLFSDRNIARFPINADKRVNYALPMPLTVEDSANCTVQLPPHSALSTAVIRNQEYKSSQQQFINQRRFNLQKITVGATVVNRANFDRYFRKTADGIAWSVP